MRNCLYIIRLLSPIQKFIAMIIFANIVVSCNMEKDIHWDEFKTNGLSDNSKMEYRDMMFVNDSLGYMLSTYGNQIDSGLIETILYVTSDGGRNWKKKVSHQGEGICIKRNKDTMLILQTIYPRNDRDTKYSQICISHNCGDNWTKKLELPFQLYNIEMITNDFWIGSCRDMIYYTKDAGDTWETHKLLFPKTDNRWVVITQNGDLAYMSNNQIMIESIESKESKVLVEFADDEQRYCDVYVYDCQKGGFLVISDSKFTNCQLYGLSGSKIQIPSNNQVGIMNMMIEEDNILINGYKVYPNGLSRSVFYYSDNNGSDWVHKDFEMGYLPSPVTFYKGEIIAYCFKKNSMIRTSLQK